MNYNLQSKNTAQEFAFYRYVHMLKASVKINQREDWTSQSYGNGPEVIQHDQLIPSRFTDKNWAHCEPIMKHHWWVVSPKYPAE